MLEKRLKEPEIQNTREAKDNRVRMLAVPSIPASCGDGVLIIPPWSVCSSFLVHEKNSLLSAVATGTELSGNYSSSQFQQIKNEAGASEFSG